MGSTEELRFILYQEKWLTEAWTNVCDVDTAQEATVIYMYNYTEVKVGAALKKIA